MKKRIVSFVLIIVTVFMVCATFTSCQKDPMKATHYATIEIENYGTIKLELYGNIAPITVENFVKLANDGFYDGLIFHRIINGFMMQGGGFTSSGYHKDATTIKGEFSSNGVENSLKHERGVISMARGEDMDSASSQFFIVHQTSPHLDGDYAAFGKVIEGIEIVDRICTEVPQGYNGAVELANCPIIKSIRVEEAK